MREPGDAQQQVAAVEVLIEGLARLRDELRNPPYGKPMDLREANAYSFVIRRLNNALDFPQEFIEQALQ